MEALRSSEYQEQLDDLPTDSSQPVTKLLGKDYRRIMEFIVGIFPQAQ